MTTGVGPMSLANLDRNPDINRGRLVPFVTPVDVRCPGKGSESSVDGTTSLRHREDNDLARTPYMVPSPRVSVLLGAPGRERRLADGPPLATGTRLRRAVVGSRPFEVIESPFRRRETPSHLHHYPSGPSTRDDPFTPDRAPESEGESSRP